MSFHASHSNKVRNCFITFIRTLRVHNNVALNCTHKVELCMPFEKGEIGGQST
jgi:hypothetical protein